MRIAVTGTPGVGKSTLAHLAAQRFGWDLADVHGLAEVHGLVVERDEDADADVVDTDRLADILEALARDRDPEHVEVLDGHLSHLLPVDLVWVVRCDPRVLEGRLRDRGYGEEKVRENLEAEAMDLILQEALGGDAPVVQRDGTRRSPGDLLSAFVDAEGNPFKRTDLEPVDWSDWLLGS